MRLIDYFKIAVGFPGEETAATRLGLALSGPCGPENRARSPCGGF